MEVLEMKIYARVVMVMLLSLFIACACVKMNNDIDDQQTQDMWNVYEKIRSGKHVSVDQLVLIAGQPFLKDKQDSPYEIWLFRFPNPRRVLVVRVNTTERVAVGTPIVSSY